MRILLLSFYYSPDLGPGALRAKSIVDSILAVKDQDLQVDVLTTVPNRYNSFEMVAPLREQSGSVVINRVVLPKHKSGMADQAYAFYCFARAVNKYTKSTRWDLVVATSSRLATASLAAWVAKRSGSMLYLDIRDLFTDTLDDLFAKSPLKLSILGIRALEGWTFRAANRINLVSDGFLPYVQEIAPRTPLTAYTNGIDAEFANTDFSKNGPAEKPVVLYAGNIGQGQGLHHIVPDVAAEFPEVQFYLIGDGGMRKTLMNRVKDLALNNVAILDPVSRCALIDKYCEVNVLFLHLNSFKAFEKVLPSKIFEYVATGKPILAGVSGYTATFLKNNAPDAQVFAPCDTDAMKVGLQKLLGGAQMFDRSNFCSQFRRQEIMSKMVADILELGQIN